MFRLFNESNDIPLAEIKKGQHLDRATPTKVKAFFSSFLYQNSPDLWVVFYTDQDYVYWGKPQKKQITPSLFNKTVISDIQDKIVVYDGAKSNSLRTRVADFLKNQYELIDGARYHLRLSDDFDISFEQLKLVFLISGELTITPVVPSPKSKNYKTTFKAIFDLETLALLNVKELPNQS